MCGITGWVTYDGNIGHERHILEKMTETMACRGPDSSGIWVHTFIGLGHARLAVIDLESGQQPMVKCHAAGDVAIVYSGEVYNFIELREELRNLGHEFNTRSDTEVVLCGYLEWGEHVAEHLNGMFAFAVWDEREHKLVMVRDRLGIKPLYYTQTKDGVLFGSEPKAIFANPQAEPTIDSDGLRVLFTRVSVGGTSPWKGILEVEPGTVTVVNRDGVATRIYWSLPTIPHLDDLDTTASKVRELLDDTVKRQLIADVPQCVLLSGGLDSSTITGIGAGHMNSLGDRLRTFSVDFFGHESNFRPDPEYMQLTRDIPYVHDVVNLVKTDHQDVMLDVGQVADPLIRRAVITARDLPGLGEMDASLYLLFKAIRRESTVALSGEGADELFGGYRWFHENRPLSWDNFPWLLSELGNDGLLTRLLQPSVQHHLDLASYSRDEFVSTLKAVDHIEGANNLDRQMRSITYLFLTRWLRNWLDRKDRMSMAVGLEVRVPFCDHRLVEYVYNAPWILKSFDGREKSLLRRAAGTAIPVSVAHRTKSGFPQGRDPAYVLELQNQAKSVFSDIQHPVFSLVSRKSMQAAAKIDPRWQEGHLWNWFLNLYHWLDIFKPNLQMD